MHLLSALHPDLPAVGPRRAAAAAAGRGRHGEKILHRAQGAEILPVTEHIQNGENPCKIRTSAVFLCPFVAYLPLNMQNDIKRYWYLLRFANAY